MDKIYLIFSFFIFSKILIASPNCETNLLGILDKDFIDEASGIVFSKKRNVLYHINDSGDGPYLYQTKLDGSKTLRVNVLNQKFIDTEDMTLGKCGNDNCIIIADFGANAKSRKIKKRTLYFIKEENFDIKRDVEVFKKIIVNLGEDEDPNTKSEIDIESMAIHPNGDLYFISKIYTYPQKEAYPSSVYKITSSALKKNSEVAAQKVFDLDLSKLRTPSSFWGSKVPTSMDISSDGKRVLILTYLDAIEFEVDLSSFKGKSLDSAQYKIINIKQQLQQEAITYLDDKSFIYSSEYVLNWFRSLFETIPQGKLFKTVCN